MLKHIKVAISILLISFIAFLTGCSGCTSVAGDSVSGTGSGSFDSNSGKLSGNGNGTAASSQYGQKSDDTEDDDNDKKDSDGNSNAQIAGVGNVHCTDSDGHDTYYQAGSVVSGSGTGTCVNMGSAPIPITKASTPASTASSATTGRGGPVASY